MPTLQYRVNNIIGGRLNVASVDQHICICDRHLRNMFVRVIDALTMQQDYNAAHVPNHLRLIVKAAVVNNNDFR